MVPFFAILIVKGCTKSVRVGSLSPSRYPITTNSSELMRLSYMLNAGRSDLEAGNDVYLKGGQLRVLAITVDKTDRENIEYVPVKAKAGYQAGYSDPEFIKGLPKFNLPNLPRTGTYRMFPIVGDSMLPIPSGSDVVGKYIEDWSTIKAKTACIVVLNGNADFVFKMVTIMGRELLLESLNSRCKPYKVNVSDVLEIWQYDRYVSKELPEPLTELEHISCSIKEILSEIHSLKRQK